MLAKINDVMVKVDSIRLVIRVSRTESVYASVIGNTPNGREVFITGTEMIEKPYYQKTLRQRLHDLAGVVEGYQF